MANEDSIEEVTCRVCGKTMRQHQELGLMHRFTEKGGLAKKGRGDQSLGGVPASQKAPSAALRGDPVLRFVMIEKGLITPEDLTAAEDKLQAMGLINNVRASRAPGADQAVGAGETAP